MTNIRDIAHDVQRDNPHLQASKADLEYLIGAAFDIILERVARGEEVSIRRFGAFAAKMFSGRNLKSPLIPGGSITFKDQLVLRFRQSQTAKSQINEMAEKASAKDKSANAKDKPTKKAKAEAEANGKAAASAAKPAKANGKAKPAHDGANGVAASSSEGAPSTKGKRPKAKPAADEAES